MCGCRGTRPCTCHWGPFNDNPDDGVWMSAYLGRGVWERSNGSGEFVTTEGKQLLKIYFVQPRSSLPTYIVAI